MLLEVKNDMMIIKRLFANLVDIILFFAVIALYFTFLFPYLLRIMGEENAAPAALSLFLIIGVYFAVQYPFLCVHQTVGKGFFGLRIISINHERPLTISVILAREILAKVMTGYLLCLPVLFGGQGKHDEACGTDVI